MKQYIITEEKIRDVLLDDYETAALSAECINIIVGNMLADLPELPAHEYAGGVPFPPAGHEFDSLTSVNCESPELPAAETDECKCGHDIGDHPQFGGCRECVCAEFSHAKPETCEPDGLRLCRDCEHSAIWITETPCHGCYGERGKPNFTRKSEEYWS